MFQAFQIRRETFGLAGNPLRSETAYGISSLTTRQANPADIGAFVRGQWEIENRAHYVRDVTFDQDRSQVRIGAAPQVMATMRNAAISLLRLAGWTNIARATERVSRRLDHILTLLRV